MIKVRHFLEYECSKCGVTVQENPPRNPNRLTDRMIEINTEPDKRICARCGGKRNGDRHGHQLG